MLASPFKSCRLEQKTASRAFLVEGNLVICNVFGGLPLLLPTAINMIST